MPMLVSTSSLAEELERRGISRRTFLKYCAGLAGVLALPLEFGPRIAKALETADKPAVVWLEFQDCAGNTESFLRAREPGVGDVILDFLSVDYHETIMSAAGDRAEASKEATIEAGGHLVVVEGSVPLGDDGIYCVIAGKTAIQHLEEATAGAAAVLNVGACSSFGGIPAASPNPTGAVGVPDLVSGVSIINLPGCPMNVDNLLATVVHFITFGALPATDGQSRPLFAYGERIHDHCERRAHFDAGQFAEEWGDAGHRLGWCLYKLGCKGPSTFHNCPSVRWNGGVNWPIGAGHGCVGCSEAGFWDTMTPFYDRLPSPPGFGVSSNVDKLGVAIVGATAVGFGAHGIAKVAQRKAGQRKEKRESEAVATAPSAGDEPASEEEA